MEAATAADLTQASEIAGRYITLGTRVMISKGYVSDLTVGGIPWKVKFDMDFCILANLGCLAGLLGPSGAVCGRQLLAKPLLKARPGENWTPEVTTASD